MRIVKSLLLALVLCFSLFGGALSETKTPSVYSLLLKLENDLKNRKPKSVLISDLTLIEKAKKNLPVAYIPDLNYLMDSEVEKVPITRLTLMKKLTYYLYPVEVALNVFLFLLLFYTFVFYLQNIDVQPIIKRIVTVVGVFFLVFSFVAGFSPLVYAVTAFGFILLTVLKKKRLSIYLMAALALLFTFQLVSDNVFLRLKSKNLLYSIKIDRDGYAPDYLIDRVFLDRKDATLEKVTSQLALGKIDSISLLRNLKFQEPFRSAVVLNDYGYVSFLTGDYQKALYFFERAFRLYPSSRIEYNLYLTYSSLLELEKANRLKDELLKKGVLVEKLPPVPILIHLPVSLPGYVFPYNLILGFGIGILAGVVFSRFFVATFGNFDPEFLLVPGMRAFINSSVRFIVLISVLILIINVILGRAICSV